MNRLERDLLAKLLEVVAAKLAAAEASAQEGSAREAEQVHDHTDKLLTARAYEVGWLAGETRSAAREIRSLIGCYLTPKRTPRGRK